MEIWKESTTATSNDDGDPLASCGENCERRWTDCHTLPVKIKILLLIIWEKTIIINYQ